MFLHVGLPKTSTSSLQNWLGGRRLELAELGIAYPDYFEGYKMKHAFISQGLRRTDGGIGPLRSTLAENADYETLVFSDEGLSNHFYDCFGQRLIGFREQCRDYEKTIILVTRSPEKWLKSYWQQCVVTPPNGASPLWGTPCTMEEIRTHPRILALLDHQKLMADMKTGYGADKVVHFEFEDPDWRQQFLDLIGAGELFETVPSENEALPPWVIEMLRQANGFSTDIDVWRAWWKAVHDFLDANNSILQIVAKQEAPNVVPDMISSITVPTWWSEDEQAAFKEFKHHVLSRPG